MSRGASDQGRRTGPIRHLLADTPLAQGLDALVAELVAGDARAWIVGGTVRDLLLGVPEIADLDAVVERDSIGLARRVADANGWPLVVLDQARGTARVITDSGAGIDINARVGTSIEDDLRQRDLTFNALALPLDASGLPEQVVDPCGGLADLENGLVRLTSEHALIEDPLRLLRVFRFSATLGFIIVPETLEAVVAHAPLLADVAPERIVAELSLILADAGSAAVLGRMDQAGLLAAIFPETGSMRGVEQNDYHHVDVLQHSLLTLDRLERLLVDLESVFGTHADRVDAFLRQQLAAGRSRLIAAKLAALLHDVGKPSARSTEHGRTTFYHHDALGARHRHRRL